MKELRNDSGVDSVLVNRFRQGDEQAASELYERYALRLQIFVEARTSQQLKRRLETDDVVQGVFFEFFQMVSTGRFDASNDIDHWNLLLVLALNTIRQGARYHSRQKRDIGLTQRFTHGLEMNHKLGDHALSDLQMTIDDLLGDMSYLKRDMIGMRILGFELEEIAKATGRSARTVKRVLRLFRDRLHTQIQ